VLKGIDRDRAAGFERPGQFSYGRSSQEIENKTELFTAKSLVYVMAKVIALKHHAVTAKLADLFGGIGAADYIEGFDSGQPGKRDESLRKSSKPVGKTRQPDAQIDPAHSSLDPATFDSALGVKGQYKDGVYK